MWQALKRFAPPLDSVFAETPERNRPDSTFSNVRSVAERWRVRPDEQPRSDVKPLPTMNVTLLDRIRQVRNLKAGDQTEYAHPAVEPRQEPVEFHFDILGQQYTARFERTGQVGAGPWGEHNISIRCYLYDEVDNADARMVGRIRDSSTTPASNVVQVIVKATKQSVYAIQPGQDVEPEPSIMAFDGPMEDAIDAIPYGGETGFADITFSYLGHDFTFEFSHRDAASSGELSVDFSFTSTFPEPHDRFRRLRGQSPYYELSDYDEAASVFANGIDHIRRGVDSMDEEHLEHFETYE